MLRLALALAPALALVPAATLTSAPLAAQDRQDGTVEEIGDNLYRWSWGNYASVFLVTGNGIVTADPINDEAAGWLRAELERRFPGQPVRTVIYSHDHPDHVYGGEVLAGPETRIVAHRMARASLVRTRAETRLPDMVFEDELVLHPAEGQTIRLRYHGPNNGRGSVSMLFEPQGVLHVVDWIVLGRVPYRDLSGYDLPGMIESTREVLAMDFDLLVGGHAETGGRAEVERYLAYLEALHEGVLSGIERGLTLEQIQSELTLEDFADLAMFAEWRALNIEGAYRQLVDDAYMLMRPEIPEPGSGQAGD